MMKIMNEMIEEWLKELLSKNNISNTESLSQDMVLNEIQEIKGTISNEKIWALGSTTKSSADMHLDNIKNFEEYIEFLETLLTQTN